MDDPGVRIDLAHADLLYGLVRAHKPRSVLEFGFGGGRSAQAILNGCAANQLTPRYVLVDNWADWGGVMPDEARAFAHKHIDAVEWSFQSERAFVAECREQFDFIMSDADHANAQRWHQRVFDCLLAPGGILCYHDVRAYANLAEIETQCQNANLHHVVFDRCSVDGEGCGRGLLVVFKGLE